MKKLLVSSFSILAISFALPVSVIAHVAVKPTQVAPGARQVFTTGVPNEHESAVVSVRVVIPEGLKSVRPHVKPGWKIEIKKSGSGEEAKVTEIIWTGGEIGVDLRDEFLFSAQAPADETELKWKAYETYADGKIVAWDEEPSEKEGNKPYSITKVIKDAAENNKTKAEPAKESKRADIAIALSGLALLTAFALPTIRSKK